MRPFSKATAAVLVAVLAQSALASAEPLLVRSGSVRFDTGDPPVMQLHGDGFDIGGLFAAVGSTGAMQCVNMPCAPGTLVNLSTVFGGPLGNFDLGLGFATIDGIQYGGSSGEIDLFFTGTLGFNAPAVAIPPGGAANLLLSAPFVFNGQVLGSTEAGGTPLFDVTLAGVGQARFGLNLYDGTYQFVSGSYTFADPIPEPAMFLLLGIGAVCVALRHRAT